MLTPTPSRIRQQWRTSTHSGPNGACVAVASTRQGGPTSRRGEGVNNRVGGADPPRTTVAVRDSKHLTRAHLSFPGDEWAALLAGLRSGEL